MNTKFYIIADKIANILIVAIPLIILFWISVDLMAQYISGTHRVYLFGLDITPHNRYLSPGEKKYWEMYWSPRDYIWRE